MVLLLSLQDIYSWQDENIGAYFVVATVSAVV